MKRLSGADAFFLYSERPTWPMHNGSVVLVDPTDAPGFGYERVRGILRERIGGVPEFAMKVKEVPLGLGRPVLVDDPGFDVDRHIQRATVPPPGGVHELAELVGSLFSRRLDRRHPLWELWVIDGLARGEVGLLMKVHHAIADGVSGASLAGILCDLVPGEPAFPPVAKPPAGRVPSDLELLASGALSAAIAPARIVTWAAEFSARTARRTVLARREGVPGPLTTAPKVPWNGRLGATRGVAFVSAPLHDVKAVGHALDATVNDVVLAVCGGALRRWLLDHGCLPDRPLIAAAPVSMRPATEGALGNRFSTIFPSLATHIADPVERLRSISSGAAAAKEINDTVLGGKDIRRLSGLVMPGLAHLGWNAYVAAGMENMPYLPSDLVISNVRGPATPLYVGGARIMAVYPIPPVMTSQGMSMMIISYVDSVEFGVTVDRERLADPWEVASHLPEALDELVAATGVRAHTRRSRPLVAT